VATGNNWAITAADELWGEQEMAKMSLPSGMYPRLLHKIDLLQLPTQ